MPNLPYYQLLTEEQKGAIKFTCIEVESCKDNHIKSAIKSHTPPLTVTQAVIIVKECLQIFMDNIKFPKPSNEDFIITSCYSSMSINTIKSKKRSVCFSDTVDCMSQSQSESFIEESIFGNQETTVYMTLFDDFSHQRTSSTQATASINKCLQVVCECDYENFSKSKYPGFNISSTSTVSVPNRRIRKRVDENIHFSDVYFFGRKSKEPKSGMGSIGSKTKIQRSAVPVKGGASYGSSVGTSTGKVVSINEKSDSQNCSIPTCRGKAVPIKDKKADKGPCLAATKGDMIATVSHIRIGPKEPCPVHGKDPCQGPKCIVASSGEEQVPVKVSTVTNPRRGVFELVVRRITGAPLAKNELMLEWTPPPSRPPSCSAPCPTPCSPPGPCRPTKCKMIVCRPSSCKPKCCKKGCKKPCGPMPCRSLPCKKCCKSSCCGKPCNPCPPPKKCSSPPLKCRTCCAPPEKCPPSCSPPRKCRRCCSPQRKCRPCYSPPPKCRPCQPPPKCRPCPPSPCSGLLAPSCCKSPCTSPCKSSPCLRPCPVGRKKPRKARSQPRIKSHKKRVSPCYNRSKNCPVVRCRSVPGPCFGCCAPPCPPRKCCSVARCKPPKCCKSSCSSCC